MILIADVGNTRIKWTRAGDDASANMQGSLSSPADPTLLCKALERTWGWQLSPARVVIGSVAGLAIENCLADWVRVRWQLDTEFLRAPSAGCGVRNAYEQPRSLGIDRWAALVAARRRYECAVVIVDCGTAVTVDALERDGQHAGGLIVPGIGLMKRTLLDNTGEISDSEPRNNLGFGRCTGDAVHWGALLAVAGLVENAVQRFEASVDGPVTTVLTGGAAPAVRPVLTFDTDLQEGLVLSGLKIMAEQDS